MIQRSSKHLIEIMIHPRVVILPSHHEESIYSHCFQMVRLLSRVYLKHSRSLFSLVQQNRYFERSLQAYLSLNFRTLILAISVLLVANSSTISYERSCHHVYQVHRELLLQS